MPIKPKRQVGVPGNGWGPAVGSQGESQRQPRLAQATKMDDGVGRGERVEPGLVMTNFLLNSYKYSQ